MLLSLYSTNQINQFNTNYVTRVVTSIKQNQINNAMKKLFMHCLSLILVVSSTVGAGNIMSQDVDNYVKIKGIFLNNTEKVSIQVFIHNPNNDTWESVKEIERKDEYVVKLDPTEKYQVWFTNNKGASKILYHNPSTSGLWKYFLDVDFNTRHNCEMLRVNDEYTFIPIIHNETACNSEVTKTPLIVRTDYEVDVSSR